MEDKKDIILKNTCKYCGLPFKIHSYEKVTVKENDFAEKIIIKLSCQNLEHRDIIELDYEEYKLLIDESLNNICKCSLCNRIINGRYTPNYCYTCKKVICSDCLEDKHENGHKNIFDYEDLDNKCLIHYNGNNNTDYFCSICKNNYCQECIDDNLEHKKDHMVQKKTEYANEIIKNNIINIEDEKNKIKEKKKKLQEALKNLDKINNFYDYLLKEKNNYFYLFNNISNKQKGKLINNIKNHISSKTFKHTTYQKRLVLDIPKFNKKDNFDEEGNKEEKKINNKVNNTIKKVDIKEGYKDENKINKKGDNIEKNKIDKIGNKKISFKLHKNNEDKKVPIKIIPKENNKEGNNVNNIENKKEDNKVNNKFDNKEHLKEEYLENKKENKKEDNNEIEKENNKENNKVNNKINNKEDNIETYKEDSKEAPKETPKKYNKEYIKETLKEDKKETPKEKNKDTPKEDNKETSKEIDKGTPKEDNKVTPKEKKKETPKEDNKETPKETPKENNINETNEINIIYYDANIKYQGKGIIDDCYKLMLDTNASIILVNDLPNLDLLFKNLQKNYPKSKFFFIVNGSSANNVINFIKTNNYNSLIINACIYTNALKKYASVKRDNPDFIGEICTKIDKISEFVKNEFKKGNIHNVKMYINSIINLKSYKNQYFPLHKELATFYGEETDKIFDSYFLVINDFITKSLNLSNDEKDNLINCFHIFSELQNKDYENIITCYLKDYSFSNFINSLLKEKDLKVYTKIGYFAGNLMHCIVEYGKKEGKGIDSGFTFYKGMELSIIDLLEYLKNRNYNITFPYFFTMSDKKEFANLTSKRYKSNKERKAKELYSVIMEIKYLYDD